MAIPPPPAPKTVTGPGNHSPKGILVNVREYRKTSPVDVPLPAEELQTPDNLFTFKCPLCYETVNVENYVNHVWTGHKREDVEEREFVKILVKERRTMLKEIEFRRQREAARRVIEMQSQGAVGGTASAPMGDASRAVPPPPPRPRGPSIPKKPLRGDPTSLRGFRCRHCDVNAPLFPTVDSVFKHIQDAHTAVDIDEEPTPVQQTNYGGYSSPFARPGGRKDFKFPEPLDRSVEELSRLQCPFCPPDSFRVDVNDWLHHVDRVHPNEDIDKDHARKLVHGRRGEIRAAREGASGADAQTSADSIRQVYPAAKTRAAHTGAESGFPCRHCGPDKNNAYFLHRSVNAYFEHLQQAHPKLDASAETLPVITERTAAVQQSTFNAVYFTGGKFPCELCHRVLHTELSLITHIDTQHHLHVHAFPEDPKKAHMKGEFPTYETIGASAWHGGNNEPYVPTGRPISVSCPLCTTGKKRVFTSEPALLAHLQTKHANLANPVQTLRDIMTQKEAPGSLRCPVCAKECQNQEALEQHVRAKHGRQAKPDKSDPTAVSWWCPTCDKAFTSGSALHNHATFKHGLEVQPLPCPACRRTFPHVFALHEHVGANHRHLDAGKYDVGGVRCPLCPDGKVFLSEEDRDVHHASYHTSQHR